jgi:enediyne biosynthesis protein E8
MTLEAFADTIVPGEKRSPEDRTVLGAATGGGAVTAGAIELLEMPESGLMAGLSGLATALNGHATVYAAERTLNPDPSVPAFVALPFDDRTALVRALTDPTHPEKDGWVGLALFCNMAFDTAAHMHTTDALAAGHPGLTMIGFAKPNSDGRWRFPDFSYRRVLSNLHPDTTPSGSPA